MAVAVVGAVVSAVVPDMLPPRPLAGAAVGLAACLLAVAAAVAIDAADQVVRGPRHVRATGAVHVATVGPRGPGDLVAWTEHRLRTEGSIRMAVAGAGIDPLRSGLLTAEVGRDLARRGWRVLLVDLHEQDGAAGLSEVIRGSFRLSEVVDYHPTLDLAEVGPGRDLAGALEGFPALASRLPRDVDALLVALPGVRHPGVLPAVAAIDGILLLAETGTTTRVELIAALDALDEARVPSEVALLSGAAVGTTLHAPTPPPAPPSVPASAEEATPEQPPVSAAPVTEAPASEPSAPEPPPAEPQSEEAPDAESVLADLRSQDDDTAEIRPVETREPEPEHEPEPDPLDRTPFASGRWTDREADVAPPPADPDDRDERDREEALRLTATLETLADEIGARENDEA